MIKYVDVGARGGVKQIVRLQKDIIEVHAFEPNPDEWEDLGKLVWWDNAKLYPYALWSCDRTLDLYITKNPGYTSVYKPLPLAEWLEVERGEQVDARTLDSFDIEPDFIKIDTQGSELDILKGSVRSLEGCTGVEAEVELQRVYEDQPLKKDVDRFMESLGFSLWKTTAVRAVVDGVWFTDAIYLKDGTEGTKTRQVIESFYNKGVDGG